MAKLTKKELAIQNHALALENSQLKTDIENVRTAMQIKCDEVVHLMQQINKTRPMTRNVIRSLKADFIRAQALGQKPVIINGKLELRA